MKFKRRFNALKDEQFKGLLERKEVENIKTNLTNDILIFINAIENNEYEPQPKPTFQEKITNIPSKYLLLAILLLEILIGILGELNA